MSIALRHLARPLVVLPSCSVARSASTNATKAPTYPPVETDANTTDTSSSSEVTPVPESKDVPVTAEIVSGAPGIPAN